MRLAAACCVMALVLAGCSSTEVFEPPASAPALPLDRGDGAGSQYGNYGGSFDGETKSPAGERCYVFNWDRPLNRDFAIRYTSASSESKEHPNWMTTTSFTRKVIPIAQSNLKNEKAEPRQ